MSKYWVSSIARVVGKSTFRTCEVELDPKDLNPQAVFHKVCKVYPDTDMILGWSLISTPNSTNFLETE